MYSEPLIKLWRVKSALKDKQETACICTRVGQGDEPLSFLPKIKLTFNVEIHIRGHWSLEVLEHFTFYCSNVLNILRTKMLILSPPESRSLWKEIEWDLFPV